VRQITAARLAASYRSAATASLLSVLQETADAFTAERCQPLNGWGGTRGATRSRNSSSCVTSSPSGQTKMRRAPALTNAVSRSAHTSAGPMGSGRERTAAADRFRIDARSASVRSATPLSSVM
jgi:hypothetical protein